MLTRYPIFIPVPDVTADTTIKALEEKFYTRFGYPEAFMNILDEGSVFKSGAMEAHCKKFGIYQDMVFAGTRKATLPRDVLFATLQLP